MAVLDFESGGFSGGRRQPTLESAEISAPRIAQPRQPSQRSPYQVPGYQPPAPPPQQAPAPAPYQFNLGAFRDAFNQQTAGKSGTLQEFIDSIFPSLKNQFPDIELFGSKQDKIRLPTGATLDAVLSAGLGGRGYAFNLDDGPGSFFSDPIGSWFGENVGSLMDLLKQPRQVPNEVNEAFAMLRNLAGGGGRISAPSNFGSGADLSQLIAATNARTNELRQEPYSATEEAALRTRAFDNLERSRQVAINEARERQAQFGQLPSSGTVEAAIQQAQLPFIEARARGENELLTGTIQERQRRRSEAQTLEQQLAEAVLANQGLTNQAQSAQSQAALQAQQASLGAQTSSANALAQLASVISNIQDPTNQLSMLMQSLGLIPAYAQQQFQNAQGLLE